MQLTRVVQVLLFVLAVKSDWIEIPQVNIVPKSTAKIPTKTSTYLSDSDVINRFMAQKGGSITTETSHILDFLPNLSKNLQNEHLKKYSTVQRYASEATTSTSSPVLISDKIDRTPTENFQLARATPIQQKDSSRVIYLHHSVPAAIVPSFENVTSKNEEYDIEDDDGITIEADDSEEENQANEQTKIFQPNQATQKVLKLVKMKPKFDQELNFSSFIEFLKKVQQSFVTKTSTNIKDKIKVLTDFRDNLLSNIKGQIGNLWKDDTHSRSKRTLMGDYDTSGGGYGMEQQAEIQFPSAEGALLTISFLTFAVFLIKLVLVSSLVKQIQELNSNKFHYSK